VIGQILGRMKDLPLRVVGDADPPGVTTITGGTLALTGTGSIATSTLPIGQKRFGMSALLHFKRRDVIMIFEVLHPPPVRIRRSQEDRFRSTRPGALRFELT
jgi:hypothetical protein